LQLHAHEMLTATCQWQHRPNVLSTESLILVDRHFLEQLVQADCEEIKNVR